MSNVVPVTQPPETQSILAVIERAARSPEVDLDKMERLLAMHERIVARDAKAAYATALARMQPHLPMIAERGGIKDRAGAIQSKYALWEDVVAAITPILSLHGFSLSFRTANDAGGVTVTGVLAHESGHSEQTSLTLPIDTSGSKNAVQSVGSSTSYGKRYTAAALLNLRTGGDDDDGKRGGVSFVTDEQAADINAMITEVKADRDALLKYFKAESVEQIHTSDFARVIAGLKAKRAQA